MSGLFMDVGPDDAICIGGSTYITVEKKSGQRVRLRFIGEAEVELMRNARKLKQARVALNPPAVATGD